MNQEQLINQLASLIDSLQNIKKGFSRTGGDTGKQVEVRVEGRSGTIRAKALMNIPPGDCTVLKTESGEWVVVSGLTPQIIKNEIISQEQNRREKKPQKKVGNAIVPILISRTVPVEKEAEPDCTCTSWRLQKILVNQGTPEEKIIEYPYESCDGGGESYEDKNAAEEAAFGGDGGGTAYAWHYKFDVKGQIHGAYPGLPWAAGIVHCAYPGAAFYGYDATNVIAGVSRDGKSYNDIALWGLAQPNFNLMTPDRLLAQYGVIIRASQSGTGTGTLIGPNGTEPPNSNIDRLGEMFGYFPIDDPSTFEGAVIRSNTGLPNTSLSAFRPLLAFYDYDDIVLGGGLEYLLPLKDYLPPIIESDGRKILCLTSLSRGWYDWDGKPIDNNWGAYQTSIACLSNIPSGVEKLGKPPIDEETGKYLMTQYYIGGITEDLIPVPHPALRSDDPNCGYISVNHSKQEIYVAIKCGSDRIKTKTELEELLETEWINSRTQEEFEPHFNFDMTGFKFDKAFTEVNTSPKRWDLKEKTVYQYPDDRKFYQLIGFVDGQLTYLQELRSTHFPSLLSSLTRCCAIHLFTFSYSKEGGSIVINLINQNTYRHGQTIPINNNNWKHPLMSSWLVCHEGATKTFSSPGTITDSKTTPATNSQWCKFSKIDFQTIGDNVAITLGDSFLMEKDYLYETKSDDDFAFYDIKSFSLNGGWFFSEYSYSMISGGSDATDPILLAVVPKLKGMSDPKIIKAIFGLYQHAYYSITDGFPSPNTDLGFGLFMPFFNYSYLNKFDSFGTQPTPIRFINTLTSVVNRENPLFHGIGYQSGSLNGGIAFVPEIFFPEAYPAIPTDLDLLKKGAWGFVVHNEICVAANLVNSEIWAVDFDQRVPAIDPTTIENLNDYINDKREQDEDSLRWKLLYNDSLITAEVRIVIPTPDTTLEDGTPVQMNKTIFQEGLKTATAKIYPLKFIPGTDRGFTVWGAAPAPWKETLE